MTGGQDDAAAFTWALGRRLRIARLTAELTQAELGDAAGMSRNFVSLLEQGGCGVDVVRLRRISLVLGLPLHELVNVDAVAPDRAEGLPS